MSSESWARKYRPMSLSEYMGADVKGLLDSRFKDPSSRPQVVLFQGPRGTGKTSAARLLAKDYLCLNPIDGHACGECEMCVEMDTKLIRTETGVEPLGVREVDIAAEGQKKTIDELISESLIEPMPPLNYKVLILDEFHMANSAVQNRLLKVMEEPPKHLCIFLCTTNPEKILQTIISRCQVKVAVRKADVEELAQRLLFICEKERVETSIAALRVIAKHCDRVPRESIMLLEEIALSNGHKVTLEAVAKATGAIASSTYVEFYKAANSGLENILNFTNKLRKGETSLKDFINGLTKFTLDSIKVRYAIGTEEYSPEFVKAVKELFKIYKTDEMDCLLQIVEYANRALAGENTDTKEELIIVTTALRIGSVGLLTNGLGNESIASEKENKLSTQRYAAEHKRETMSLNHTAHTGSEDALLTAVFGRDTAMITKAPSIMPTVKRPSIGGDDDAEPSIEDDDKFLERFIREEDH